VFPSATVSAGNSKGFLPGLGNPARIRPNPAKVIFNEESSLLRQRKFSHTPLFLKYLWKIGRFREFLEARKELLAAELNRRMEELLHGDTRWLTGPATAPRAAAEVPGGITSEDEEIELETINDWVEANGLPRGILPFDLADPETGDQTAVLDLAWPNGILEELSQPVAVLLNEDSSTIALASQAGFRCFTDVAAFRSHVEVEVLGMN
jgi:hypothetical protein